MISRQCIYLSLFMLSSAVIAAPVPVTGDPVLYWNEVFLGGLPFNPGQQRGAALMGIAVFDAANATFGSPNNPYIRHLATPGGDTRAAVSAAAHAILRSQYPGRAAEFDAALASSLALVPDGAAKTNGVATGQAYAAAILARRAGDGNSDVVPYTPSGLPGRWAPTPPGFGPPVQPGLAAVDPWLMPAPDAFRLPPPPALDSPEYKAAYDEVKAIGSATSATRTANQAQAAVFWASAMGPGPYIRGAIDAADAQGLSTIENARLFGLLTTSVADAVIAVWDTKYHYDYWRPVTGIRAGDADGNPMTEGDAGWSSFIVAPPHPSYASAHSAIAGAASAVLDDVLGTDVPFCFTSSAITRCYDSFGDAALESADSRLWGGIHWRFDNEGGLTLGRAVGAYDLGRSVFDPVPAPGALALLGLGVAGIAARSTRRRDPRDA